MVSNHDKKKDVDVNSEEKKSKEENDNNINGFKEPPTLDKNYVSSVSMLPGIDDFGFFSGITVASTSLDHIANRPISFSPGEHIPKGVKPQSVIVNLSSSPEIIYSSISSPALVFQQRLQDEIQSDRKKYVEDIRVFAKEREKSKN